MNIEYDDDLFDEEEKENTPKRVEKTLDEWKKNWDLRMKVFPNPGYQDLIILTDIDFSSMCAHHLLPFIGKAHVGYVPNKSVCGISKLARIVDCFASRPQIQERMTQQIIDCVMENLEPLGAMVVVEGQHECMRIRGVRKKDSWMITSAVRGEFERNHSLKDEFLKLIGK